jgi:hypothetical protein
MLRCSVVRLRDLFPSFFFFFFFFLARRVSALRRLLLLLLLLLRSSLGTQAALPWAHDRTSGRGRHERMRGEATAGGCNTAAIALPCLRLLELAAGGA